jgi:beta-galactosidase GanA
VDSPSPFATASLEADKRAFAAVMQHLKETDPQRTVIMVQVENEPATGRASAISRRPPRNSSKRRCRLRSSRPCLRRPTSASPNWQQAFGPDADEYFNAWATAKYVGEVAAAGKAVYPLPMDVNDALRNPFHPGPPGEPGAPGNYESGGPTDNVIPIWKAAAPAIDLLVPTIIRAIPPRI